MPAFLPKRPILRGAVYTVLGAVAPLLCETFRALGVDTSGGFIGQIVGPVIGLVLGGGVAAGAYRDATLVDHKRREVRRRAVTSAHRRQIPPPPPQPPRDGFEAEDWFDDY